MRRVTAEDFPTINGWYGARGGRPVPVHMFPEIGFIVDNVGAGFIYQTDSSLCFLDGYISSPVSTKEERNSAFEKISSALIRTAKDHGFSQILAYTKNHGVKRMCDKFSFELKGEYSLYVRGI